MYDDMDEVRPWRVELELKYDLLPIGKGRDADLLSGNWWTWSGSNRRPLPCHGSALPTAPQAHFLERENCSNQLALSQFSLTGWG